MNDLTPGKVIKIHANGRKFGVFVIRTYRDTSFRAIPEPNPLAYLAAAWFQAGRLDELTRHRQDLETASQPFERSQIVTTLDANAFAAKQFKKRTPEKQRAEAASL